MPSFKSREGVPYSSDELMQQIARYPLKFAWFFGQGYKPHNWQTLFHTLTNPDTDRLCRFRHLVAGRRGGKTLSAAWEMLFYLLHPEQFHIDAHGQESQRPLTCWVLTRDYPAGLPALMTFREVIKQAGLEHGREFKENRGNRWFEFENGSYLFFKTADEPDALRGAGLDILWMDEAAFIPNESAWNVVRPALSDKMGLVISTTTPSGKNWFYDEFWREPWRDSPSNGSVEYWSIDNPFFPREEWEEVRRRYHPLLFKQEYCAAFDSMAGKELNGDWLHYYKFEDLPRVEGSKRIDLDLYVGVDPAISLADTADRFTMSLLGVTRDGANQVYLLDQFAGRIPFADQIDKIKEWHLKYRPKFIAIESNAFQAALSQQAQRLESMPSILPILNRGKKKSERILSMAPLFKVGKVRIREDQRDFIDEWLDYDSTLKNPKDDCLDSVEIALSAAGAILAEAPEPELFDTPRPAGSLDELAARDRVGSPWRRERRKPDEHLGSFW